MTRTFIFSTFALLSFACGSDSTPTASAQELAIVNAFPNLSFNSPVFLTSSKDGSNRIFVVEQPGVIRVFENDSTVSSAATFLDITDRVAFGGEMGLLGLAFHPDYAINGLFYVDYTASSPRRTVISQFTASGNQADPNSEVIILQVSQPFSNHNGGMIDFDSDGLLYIALGDGGDGGDPEENGQDKTTLLASILRIDIDNQDQGLNYAIPATNPFVGEGNDVREEIFAFGLRNPWRFSIDQQSGQIWAGDVGQGSWEEVDLIERGGNYGWKTMEGLHCFSPSSNCDQTGLTPPIAEYNHGAGCSITGGYIYRGPRRPELNGAYIYGDYCSGTIWMLRYENNQVTENTTLLPTSLSIASFGVDEQNELYILDLGGEIYRFVGNPLTSVAGDGANRTPQGFVLGQNYPNPFNPTTTIKYSIIKAGLVELSIFNSLGQKIRTLITGVHPAGAFEITWDGRNARGEAVASGTYLYQLNTKSFEETQRMTLVR